MGDKRRTRNARRQNPVADEPSPGLPPALTALIADSLRLQDRITRMDTLIDDPQPNAVGAELPYPLESQMSRLRQAFCA